MKNKENELPDLGDAIDKADAILEELENKLGINVNQEDDSDEE